MLTTARLFTGLALALTTVAVFACGSSTDGNGTFPDDGGGGGGDDGGGGGGGFVDGSGGGGGGGNNDGAACSAPVDMYIMFDRSGSMGADCNIGGTTTSKWCRSVNALSGYFNGAGSTGQAAALQFFPLPDHTDTLCTTGDEYNLAAAPAASAQYVGLPTASFDTLLNATTPDSGGNGKGTPTEAAIRGMTRFTSGNRRGGRVTIGILITDGDPNGCDENLTDLSNLLDAHHTATQIRTYVIGMQGANFSNLEKIAVGGNAPMHDNKVGPITNACGNGAATCRAWNVGDGDPTVFTAALAAIQASADGCKDGGGFVNPK